MKFKKGAFTLIELLIVVAIIAILAAIAVPNFLQAQTRAKISRVKADMRTLATAIEEYQVDYNRAPVGINEGRKPFFNWFPPNGSPEEGLVPLMCLSHMTTPIAYITSIPKDPFGGFYKPSNARAPEYFEYQYNMGLPPLNLKAFVWPPLVAGGFTWTLNCPGPSHTFTSPFPWNMLAYSVDPTWGPARPPDHIYDPTNGTASVGFIIMTNKGYTNEMKW